MRRMMLTATAMAAMAHLPNEELVAPAPLPDREPSGTDRKKAKMGRKAKQKMRRKKRRAKIK